jgi:hypothetical protein
MQDSSSNLFNHSLFSEALESATQEHNLVDSGNSIYSTVWTIDKVIFREPDFLHVRNLHTFSVSVLFKIVMVLPS